MWETNTKDNAINNYQEPYFRKSINYDQKTRLLVKKSVQALKVF